jgi:acetylornithine deacetylase/succinyl-diaminopimelate desuccinylase-like protein
VAHSQPAIVSRKGSPIDQSSSGQCGASMLSPTEAAELESEVPWSAVLEHAVDLLRQYLRFPTVNDPLRLSPSESLNAPWLAGCEAEAANWLFAVLKNAAINSELLESAPGRVNLIARLTTRTSSKPPLILLSHSDVVPVRRQEWDSQIDPFSGAVRDGYIYGRGALDLKGLGIAHVIIAILLHKLKVPLKRDVVLLVVADEEAGGHFGTEWLLRHRPELMQCGLVLGEGGFSIRGLWHNRDVHAIAVAEKGCLELECIAEANGHHASIISGDAPPARLVAALNRVLNRKFKTRMTSATKAFFETLSDRAEGPARFLFRIPIVKSQLTARHLSKIPAIKAMLNDTIALTVLESGVKGNLVPGQARAVLNIRLLPGSDLDTMREEISQELAKDSIRVTQLPSHTHPANASEFQTQEFAALAKCAGAKERDIVTPILSPGASDGRYFRAAGVPCYGWVPFPISGADLGGVHGPNERLAISSFEQGIRSLYRAVVEIVS